MEANRKKIDPDRLPVHTDADLSFAARMLIRIGIKNNDQETKKIGQARLRILEGKGTVDDYELLGIEIPRDLPNK